MANNNSNSVKEASDGWRTIVELDEMAENDDVLDPAVMAAVLDLFDQSSCQRSIKWKNNRINWKEHVKRELHTGTFDTKYHMPYASFTKLVSLIRDDITLDVVKSMNSSGGNTPIYPELIIHIHREFIAPLSWALSDRKNSITNPQFCLCVCELNVCST